QPYFFRIFLINPPGGDRNSRINEESPSLQKRSGFLDLLTGPRNPSGGPGEKKREIASEPPPHCGQFFAGPLKRPEAVEPDQGGRGVAASSPQAGGDRNLLDQRDRDPPGSAPAVAPLRLLLGQLRRPENQIRTVGRKGSVLDLQLNPGALPSKGEEIVESDHLHQGEKVVIAVFSPA